MKVSRDKSLVRHLESYWFKEWKNFVTKKVISKEFWNFGRICFYRVERL